MVEQSIVDGGDVELFLDNLREGRSSEPGRWRKETVHEAVRQTPVMCQELVAHALSVGLADVLSARDDIPHAVMDSTWESLTNRTWCHGGDVVFGWLRAVGQLLRGSAWRARCLRTLTKEVKRMRSLRFPTDGNSPVTARTVAAAAYVITDDTAALGVRCQLLRELATVCYETSPLESLVLTEPVIRGAFRRFALPDFVEDLLGHAVVLDDAEWCAELIALSEHSNLLIGSLPGLALSRLPAPRNAARAREILTHHVMTDPRRMRVFCYHVGCAPQQFRSILTREAIPHLLAAIPRSDLDTRLGLIRVLSWLQRRDTKPLLAMVKQLGVTESPSVADA